MMYRFITLSIVLTSRVVLELKAIFITKEELQTVSEKSNSHDSVNTIAAKSHFHTEVVRFRGEIVAIKERNGSTFRITDKVWILHSLRLMN